MIVGLSGDGVAAPHHRRSLLDASGTSWQVYERNASHVPGARGERCLIFECDRAWRRAWRYPEHWEELTEAELRSLGRIE